MVEKNNIKNQELYDDQIDLLSLLKIIIQRKNIIFIFSFLSVLISSIHIYAQKRTYSGNFEIVVQKRQMQSLSNFNIEGALPILNQISPNSKSNKLETEKEILSSYYVLNPVFEYAKDLKNKSNLNSINWKFEDFSSNLKIDIKKGTSVFNVIYKDTNKDHILPILNKISERYRSYSIESEIKTLDKAILYLEKQIDLLRKNVKENTIKTERYGLDNGIINEFESLKLYDFNANLSKPAKQITRKGDTKKNEINRYSYIFQLLQKLEAEKLENSIYIKPNDPKMITLSKKINKLKTSLSKPKEVLLKYNQLLRLSESQNALLRVIELNYETAKLEKSKINEPWRIISLPKLKEKPIGPKRSIFVFTSFIISTFIGMIFALIYNKKCGVMFSIEDYKRIFNNNYLKFKISDIELCQKDLILYFRNLISDKKNQKFGFLSITNNHDINKEFSRMVESVFMDNHFKITEDIDEISDYNYIFLIIIEGLTDKQKLQEIKNTLEISGINIVSTLYLFK